MRSSPCLWQRHAVTALRCCYVPSRQHPHRAMRGCEFHKEGRTMMQMSSLMRKMGLLVILFSISAMGQENGGYLKTKVNPGRAGVFIDGKYVGPAANFRVGRKYSVPAGQHEVKLVEPRYEEV